MILQALYEYYQRKALNSANRMEPEGFEWKSIPFIIVIDKNGNFVQLKDTREGEGKNQRAKRFLVVKGTSRTIAIKPYIFWDHYGYVLAQSKTDSIKDKEQAEAQQNSFINSVNSYCNKFPKNEQFAAVGKFYKQENYREKVFADPCWKECIKKAGTNLSFEILGESLIVAEHPDLKETINSSSVIGPLFGEEKHICLITGKMEPIAILHTAIPIIGGKSGAKLVGFQKNSGYDSYHKEQGMNAPISRKAEAAYTTALKTLLEKDSQNKYRLGNTSVVFWSEKPSFIEDSFAAFFESPPKEDPDANIRVIKSFYESIHSGKLSTEGNTKFYVLGIAPNAARIAVRFWKEGTVKDFSERIEQHFEDLKIIRDKNEKKEFLSLFNLLTSISLQNKIDNIPPNLENSIMISILDGIPYPTSMQMQCLLRIKAEQQVTYSRASILKAYLNKKNRITNHLTERNITMALDLENYNQGYLCGRLFAVLERIQEIAQPEVNSGIKNRYYTAASTTPITVFSRLLSLSNHHLSKLSEGYKVYFEKQIQEIINSIDSEGMPTHLSLDDQSRFAIGYYHQRKHIFTTKERKEEEKGEQLKDIN